MPQAKTTGAGVARRRFEPYRSTRTPASSGRGRFRRIIEESSLPFRAHAEFRKADLDARQELCRSLAERIWTPERLEREAAS